MSRKTTESDEVVLAPETLAVGTKVGKFTVARQVSLPFWHFTENEPAIIRINSPITESVEKTDKKTHEALKDEHGVVQMTAHKCNITLFSEDGLLENDYSCVVGVVFHSKISEMYPKDKDGVPSYIGKVFMVTDLGKRQGSKSKARDWTIVELTTTPDA
jgi:hypothetical protein